MNRKLIFSGKILFFVILTLSFVIPGVAQQEDQADNSPFPKAMRPLEDVFTYVYAASRWVGRKVTGGMNDILPPDAKIQDKQLSDGIGVMILLTLFLAIAEVAKKITWFLVVAGWILVLIRIGWIVGNSYI